MADVSAGCSTLADCDGRSSVFGESCLLPSSLDAVSLLADSGLADSGLPGSIEVDAGSSGRPRLLSFCLVPG